jgi:hypothetical protein
MTIEEKNTYVYLSTDGLDITIRVVEKINDIQL